jgi:hypothetical protein
MWKINIFAIISLIIGSYAVEIPPLLENACEVTGFTVFHKKHLEGNPVDRIYDPLTEIYIGSNQYTGRIILDDYPQKKINIKTNVDSSPNCVLPQCVKTSFIPQWPRFAPYSAISTATVPPYAMYPDLNKPEKQYNGYLSLKGEAFHTSDCTGTPYSNMTQDVQTVLEASSTTAWRPVIVTYNGTTSPASVADSTAIASATCNFLRDALGNGFIYIRNFNQTGYPTNNLTDFQCQYEFVESAGPLSIMYQITTTYDLPKTHAPNFWVNQEHPYVFELYWAMLTYLDDVPVRTIGTTEEVMSTRIKNEIASTSQYQSYTKLVATVEPFTQFYSLKDLIISYIGKGGVPVKASDRKAVVDATCTYLRNTFPLDYPTESVTISNFGCKLKSHSSNGIPLVLTYDVDITLTVGPVLDTFTLYTELKDQDFLKFSIDRMFEDRYFYPENITLEMSTFVNNAIGPNNPFYNYTKVSIVQFLEY